MEGETGPLRVPPGRQEVVLAGLLLDMGRVVATDHLVDVLWDHNPPDTARTQVQICISRLRRSLATVNARIETRSSGYLLRADRGSLDADLYREGVDAATVLDKEGRTGEAAARMRAVLDLWRGPALDGIDAPYLRTKADRLDKDWLNTLERCFDLELALGRHQRLVGEIREFVDAHPLHEGLRGQLMLALYRTGRQAEALEAYREGRDLLVERLGLDPGERLREMEAAILGGDSSLQLREHARLSVDRPEPAPVLAAEAAEPVDNAEAAASHPRVIRPDQLPADVADFVGRDDAVRGLRQALVGDGATGVAVLFGRPGIGKSATAVRAAHHDLAADFPDGRLYCDLRATREEPLRPTDVLGRFLRALGVPGTGIPDDLDERGEIYRTLLASRRILVVLDDAVSEAQVAPLLPGVGDCAVIVSSRVRLTGLPGAKVIELGGLSEEHSLELLANVVGRDRVEAEPESARALLGTIGRLPLALRIVAARLAARPHWPLASMVDRLADERRRLDELAHGDMTVRVGLSLTYDGLPPSDAQVFRLLGLVDGSTIPAWVPGAVMDDHRPFPGDLAEPLVDAHMLDISGIDVAGEPVYRFHDLVRDFSRERLLREEPAAERAIAEERLTGGWLALVDEANREMMGGNYLQVRGGASRGSLPRAYVERLMADPMAWVDQERANLRTAVRQAGEAGLDEHAWELVSGLTLLFNRHGHLDDVEEIHRQALPVVRAAGNRRGEAALGLCFDTVCVEKNRFAKGRSVVEYSLRLFTEVGDPLGQALASKSLAYHAQLRGDVRDVIAHCEPALALFREVGDPVGQRSVLTHLGLTYVMCGDHDASRVRFEEALDIAEKLNDVRGRAQVLRRMAQADRLRGEFTVAADRILDALELLDTMVDPVGEACLLHDLGRVRLAQGRPTEAQVPLERALEIRELLRAKDGVASVTLTLAKVAAMQGDAARASALASQARGSFVGPETAGERKEADRIIAAG
ncbi:DNA-binding SARP family transcriptional activator [Nocardiopsis terrae]|uniref:DNA-binding SARP family transcriptional activator n=1 Tax=Nocardiopsis terrae TaxID=372655 RepID=A0ABR9HA88_9ACTN|nr:DNA-binding SARP family transcriptional activator [Nocardiopsis terrae]